MIEYLTASLRDTPDATDSRASMMRAAWVARMVQLGTLPILLISIVNIVEFYPKNGARWSWALGCALVNFFLSFTCLSLSFTRWFSRNWLPVVCFLLTALIASKTVLGITSRDPMLLFVSSILLMAGTGSMLPWPTRVQVYFDLMCLAAWSIQSLWLPAVDGNRPYEAAALLTAMIVSLFTCYARDSFVTAHEKSNQTIKESEGALRQIFDANTDCISLIDRETRRIFDVNEQFIHLSGFRRDELIGGTTDDLNVWPDPKVEEEFMRRIVTDGRVTNMEANIRTKDGRIVPCLLSSVIVVIRGRTYVMTLTRDVTELRKSQEKLRESEEKFRLIFEASRDAMMVTKVSDSRVSDLNSQFLRLSGFTREELIGRTSLELGMWAVPEQRVALLKSLTERGYIDDLEMLTRIRSGQVVPVLVSAVAVKLAGEDCYIWVARDISMMKAAEQKIRDSEATQRRIFDAGLDCMSIVEMATGNYLDVNESFCRETGFRRDEVIGSNFFNLGLWPDEREWTHFTESLVMTGEIRNQRVTHRTKDGTLVPYLLSAVQCELWGKLCCISTARDVSTIKAAEQKIRDSEATQRKIFDAGVDWMSIIDLTTGSYLDVNESFCRAHGLPREEIIGSSFYKLGRWPNPKEWKHFVKHLILSGEVRNQRVTFRMKDGTDVPCLISAVRCELWGKQCCIATTRDITDLNEAQEKVRRSEETFRKIFDASLDSMSIIDAVSTEYIDVNPEFLRATGYTREEIIGKTADDVGLWVDQQQQRQFANGLNEKGEVRNMQADARLKDGSIVTCLTSGVLAEIGGKLCCLGVSRDITEIKAAEQKLRQSEAMLRAIFDNSLDSISLLDLSTQTLVEVNAELTRVVGYSREEMIGKTFDDLVPAADPVRQEELVLSLMQGRELRNFEITFATRSGRTFPVLLSAAIFMIDGRPHSLSVARDITMIKEAEEKLRKSEALLRAIFDNSLDNVALFDLTDQTIIEVNKELTRTIGYSREEMLGKRLDDLVPRGDPVRQGEFFAMLMRGREVRNFEMDVSSREGRRIFPALVSASIVEIDGRPCALSAARDISDLVKAREAALAASRAKSEFLSIMSHEIRTPMNAILGMADLMGESNLNSEQRRYLDTILSNGNALLELINSILDLAKVESGRLSLETVEFDLIELTERAADTLAVRAHEKAVELAVRFAPDLPSTLTGDPHRLRQILNNLIGNAIKFTKQGEVVVEVGCNLDREVPGNLRFEVHDTGIGIAPDKIENIFSIFTQADTSTTRKFGGSGLGLAIVQRLVALMGGRVWAESELGKGSTFFFTVDLRVPEASSAPALPPTEPGLRGVRTLIVIDHATARTVVAERLRAHGAEVTETASEAEALALLTAANRPATQFGLLVVDGEMQSSDGYAALRQIRTIEPNAAVVMLTNSNGLPAKLRRMREHGVRHYITKPIKRQELYRVIAEALAKSAPGRMLPQPPREAPASVAAPATIADRPLKILLADDSPDNRLLIRAYTKKTPYVLTEVENGQIAVERFVDGSYDLVLMDIQMPVLDGYSAVRAIRKWELERGSARTPIIALTASALEEDVRRAKEAGCDMHVSKPVKKLTLLDAIARAMEAGSKAAAIDQIEGNGTQPIAAIAASADPAASNADFHI